MPTIAERRESPRALATLTLLRRPATIDGYAPEDIAKSDDPHPQIMAAVAV